MSADESKRTPLNPLFIKEGTSRFFILVTKLHFVTQMDAKLNFAFNYVHKFNL